LTAAGAAAAGFAAGAFLRVNRPSSRPATPTAAPKIAIGGPAGGAGWVFLLAVTGEGGGDTGGGGACAGSSSLCGGGAAASSASMAAARRAATAARARNAPPKKNGRFGLACWLPRHPCLYAPRVK
jgi:hypothetical protein